MRLKRVGATTRAPPILFAIFGQWRARAPLPKGKVLKLWENKPRSSKIHPPTKKFLWQAGSSSMPADQAASARPMAAVAIRFLQRQEDILPSRFQTFPRQRHRPVSRWRARDPVRSEQPPRIGRVDSSRGNHDRAGPVEQARLRRFVLTATNAFGPG